MQKKELTDLGLSEEVANQILVIHGKDIEKHKNTVTTLYQRIKDFETQIAEANSQIESFKGLNIDEIKAKAAEWETKAKQAQTEAEEKIKAMQFDHALESSLSGAKAKSLKAVRALIDTEGLKLKEDGTIDGLEDQLTKIKAENDYLFSDAKETPKITTGGNLQPISANPMLDAALKQAGVAKKT